MRVEIDQKTPTINHLYGHHGFRKYLKPEAKKLRDYIIELINNQVTPYEVDKLKEKKTLTVVVDIYENWYTKNGEVKRKDVANREKFLIDSIFEALGLDDKKIFEHRMRKIQSEKEGAIITIL